MEFLELFLPEMAKTIDPGSIKFLKQEYFVDLVEGEEKIIDLLVEVKQAGIDATFLIHIEPQATSRSIFPERMFSILLDFISFTESGFIRLHFFPMINLKKKQQVVMAWSFPTSKFSNSISKQSN